MPRVTLTFELPMEQEEFTESYHGGEYLSRLREIDEYCRGKLEYQDPTEAERVIIRHIRGLIGEVHQ